MRVLDNGNCLFPLRFEGPNGLIGDGAEEGGPEHPGWAHAMRDLCLDLAFGVDLSAVQKMERIRGKGYCAKHAIRFPDDDFWPEVDARA